MPARLLKCAALAFVSVLVAGCATIQPAPRVVLEDPQTMVRLDTDTSLKRPGDPKAYTHPADIQTSQLQTIFDAIRIQAQRLALQKRYRGTAPRHQVFEADEIVKLAPIVKDAFSQASPQERVVFALTKPSSAGQDVTMGELYIRGEHLHFILSCYRFPTTGKEPLSQCQEVARQGFELSFVEDEFFVSFGQPGILLGNSTKELIIDFSTIPHTTASGS